MKTWICRFAMLSLAASAPFAQAQSVEFIPAEGDAAALLAHDAQVMADAFARYRRSRPAQLADLPRKVERPLRNKLLGATLAHFRYQPPGGRPAIDIHSRSGRSMEGTFEQLMGTTDGGSSTEAGAAVTPTEAARDASEAEFYPADTPTSVRAPNLQRKPNWVVVATENAEKGAIIGGGDAELKSLRKLESIFETSPESRGGELVGYVSKAACGSCKQAFEAFTQEYGVDARIYYLDETPEGGASLKASNDLRAFRKGLVKRVFEQKDGVPDDRWALPYDASRLAAAEAGSLTASDACL